MPPKKGGKRKNPPATSVQKKPRVEGDVEGHVEGNALSEDKTKKPTLKAYPKLLESSVKAKSAIYANRRGIVPLHSPIDKPVMTVSELINMRKIGLSYKQIGRKLGIDSHKEDVIQVYKSLGANVQSIKGPAKVAPPTPLWYLFESERELIKTYILPSQADVKQLLPQYRVMDRLGENAGFMLDTYLKVNTIVNEEIQSAFNGVSSNSSLGAFKKWDGDLAGSVIQKAFEIQSSVSRAALQLSSNYGTDVGRCMCSAIKTLRFCWKESPIPHPSFFWGCTRYTPVDAYKHDKGTPVRQTFWNIVGDDSKVTNIADKNLRLLHQKTALALTFWDSRDDNDEDLLKQAFSLYGGPVEFESSQEVLTALRGISKDLTYSLEQRAKPDNN